MGVRNESKNIFAGMKVYEAVEGKEIFYKS